MNNNYKWKGFILLPLSIFFLTFIGQTGSKIYNDQFTIIPEYLMAEEKFRSLNPDQWINNQNISSNNLKNHPKI